MEVSPSVGTTYREHREVRRLTDGLPLTVSPCSGSQVKVSVGYQVSTGILHFTIHLHGITGFHLLQHSLTHRGAMVLTGCIHHQNTILVSVHRLCVLISIIGSPFLGSHSCDGLPIGVTVRAALHIDALVVLTVILAPSDGSRRSLAVIVHNQPGRTLHLGQLGNYIIGRVIGQFRLLVGIVLTRRSQVPCHIGVLTIRIKHPTAILHIVIHTIALQPRSIFQTIHNGSEVLEVNGIVLWITSRVASWPTGPVGSVVHLGNPDGTSCTVLDTRQRTVPAWPVAIPVTVHYHKVTTPSASINGVHKLIEPVQVTGHSRRTETTACGHKFRPNIKHLLDGCRMFAVIPCIVRFIICHHIGGCSVVSHLGKGRPPITRTFVPVVLLCHIFKIIRGVNTCIPVVVPSGIQQVIRFCPPAAKPLLAGIIPLADTQCRDGVTENRGQIHRNVFLVGYKDAVVSRVAGRAPCSEPDHISTLQGEALYLVVHRMAGQRLVCAHTELCRLARLSFLGIDSQGSDAGSMRQDDTAVGIHLHHAVAVLHSSSSIDANVLQVLLQHLRRFHTR